MEFYPALYIGDSVEQPKKIIRKLKSRKKYALPGIYIIAFAQGKDQLEIYPANCLQQDFYKKNPPFTVGIAGSHEEAVDLVVEIVRESIRAGMECNLKSYLMQHMD